MKKLCLAMCCIILSSFFAFASETPNEAKDGYAALLSAAADGNEDVLLKLIKNGADINARSSAGQTALMAAALNSRSNIVKILVKQGADLDMKDKNGNTALMLAVHACDIDTVLPLILAKADLEIKNNDGKTALDIAVENKQYRCTRQLRAHGAKQKIRADCKNVVALLIK